MVCERIHVNEGVVDTITPSLSTSLKQICIFNSGHAELSLVCYCSNIYELQGSSPNRHIYTTNRNLSSFTCSQSRGSGGVTSQLSLLSVGKVTVKVCMSVTGLTYFPTYPMLCLAKAMAKVTERNKQVQSHSKNTTQKIITRENTHKTESIFSQAHFHVALDIIYSTIHYTVHSQCTGEQHHNRATYRCPMQHTYVLHIML